MTTDNRTKEKQVSKTAEQVVAEALGIHVDHPDMWDLEARDVVAALRDAGMLAETGWEYGVNMGWGQNPPMIQWVTDSKEDALADIEGVPRRSLVRRRRAGEWEEIPNE